MFNALSLEQSIHALKIGFWGFDFMMWSSKNVTPKRHFRERKHVV